MRSGTERDRERERRVEATRKRQRQRKRESLVVDFMDWDLKMPPWNASESADSNAGLSIGSVVAGAARDCSVDLKLGGLGEFGSSSSSSKRNVRRAAMPAQSKRPRAPPASGGGQAASCLVDGCRADLGKCREYHRRHKVCEAHSKTPVVVVRGQEQRFCQQCSRYYLSRVLFNCYAAIRQCYKLPHCIRPYE